MRLRLICCQLSARDNEVFKRGEHGQQHCRMVSVHFIGILPDGGAD